MEGLPATITLVATIVPPRSTKHPKKYELTRREYADMNRVSRSVTYASGVFPVIGTPEELGIVVEYAKHGRLNFNKVQQLEGILYICHQLGFKLMVRAITLDAGKMALLEQLFLAQTKDTIQIFIEKIQYCMPTILTMGQPLFAVSFRYHVLIPTPFLVDVNYAWNNLSNGIDVYTSRHPNSTRRDALANSLEHISCAFCGAYICGTICTMTMRGIMTEGDGSSWSFAFMCEKCCPLVDYVETYVYTDVMSGIRDIMVRTCKDVEPCLHDGVNEAFDKIIGRVTSNYMDIVRAARRRECFVCGVATKGRCGSCRFIHYCSIECQTKEWHNHKARCTALQDPTSWIRLKDAKVLY